MIITMMMTMIMIITMMMMIMMIIMITTIIMKSIGTLSSNESQQLHNASLINWSIDLLIGKYIYQLAKLSTILRFLNCESLMMSSNGSIWVLWRLKSPASRLFTQPFADQRKHQSSASLAFVWGIHRGPVNSPHKWPVTRKMFPFDGVIMEKRS